MILDSEVTVLLFSFSENYFEGQEDDKCLSPEKDKVAKKQANVRKVEMRRTVLHYLDSRSHSSEERFFQNIVAESANNNNRPHFYSFPIQK